MKIFNLIGLFVIVLLIDSSYQNSCIDEHSTMCHLKNGTNTCCPIKDAVCCEQDGYCCPKGND